jgi:predicted RND superfamily exporter protein
MVATCIVIVIGFSVLLLSAFTPMRTFGGLTAIGLVLARVCDVVVMPFLLRLVADQRRAPHHAETIVSRPVAGAGAGTLHAG